MSAETLGIVGVGGLASFMVEGLRHAGDRRQILLSPRNAARSAELASRFGCRIARDTQAVVDGAGIVIVATAPADVLATIAALRWRAGQRLVCTAIDVKLELLRAAAPEAFVIRAMPSAAAAIGLGATPIYPADEAAAALLREVGEVYPVETERAFDAATALAGYHLWTYALMDAMVRSAEAAGLQRAAAIGMVGALTRSAASLVMTADPTASVRAPLDEHGRPGTMTAQGMAVIDAADALTPWREAYVKALRRLTG